MTKPVTVRTFEARLKSHLRKTGNLITERQELIVEAYDVATASNNFNKISALFNGLWAKGAYAACHTIKNYLEAHSPMTITFKKDAAVKFTIKLQAKETDGTRPPYTPLQVAYNEWAKASVEEDMTAAKLIGRIESVIKATATLSDAEAVKFAEKYPSLVAA